MPIDRNREQYQNELNKRMEKERTSLIQENIEVIMEDPKEKIQGEIREAARAIIEKHCNEDLNKFFGQEIKADNFQTYLDNNNILAGIGNTAHDYRPDNLKQYRPKPLETP